MYTYTFISFRALYSILFTSNADISIMNTWHENENMADGSQQYSKAS